jgi:hypothetical protein
MSKQDYVAIAKNVLHDSQFINKNDIDETYDAICNYILLMFKMKEYKAISTIVEERTLIKLLCKYLEINYDYQIDDTEESPEHLIGCLWKCEDQKLCEDLLKDKELCKYLSIKQLVDEKDPSNTCLDLINAEIANRKLKMLSCIEVSEGRVFEMWNSENQDCCKFVLENKNLVKHLSFKQITDENHAVYKRVWKDCLQLLKIEVYNRKTKINMAPIEWEPAMQRIYRLMEK